MEKTRPCESHACEHPARVDDALARRWAWYLVELAVGAWSLHAVLDILRRPPLGPSFQNYLGEVYRVALELVPAWRRALPPGEVLCCSMTPTQELVELQIMLLGYFPVLLAVGLAFRYAWRQARPRTQRPLPLSGFEAVVVAGLVLVSGGLALG